MIERIFLIGFMGTGKTTVGAELSQALGWKMFDCDQVLVEQEGRSIPEIFAADGEAYFREVEASVLRDLSKQRQAVITTGGGVVLRAENCERMQKTGLVVQLKAEPEEILRRVANDPNRPLLQGDDVRKRVEALLLERNGLYDFAELAIDTTNRSLEEIVGEIIQYLSASSR